MLAVADDRDRPRVFKLRISHGAAGLVVTAAGVIYLQPSRSAPESLDPEAIAVGPDGHMYITSEGITNEEPRLPPAIVEYSADGSFVKQIAVRGRYLPNERGPLATGVRDNASFESLTMTADGLRMFTATELPLIQDGEADPFASGARSRLLEYVRVDGSYEPRREFVYEIEPIERPGYDMRFAITGIVELLSLGGTDLLALERGFVESADRQNSMNRIRLFRISLDGATDVSAVESLHGVQVRPVTKTLIADVNRLPGLAPPLTTLDNFEGMAFGPPDKFGRPLLLVSDDNFSERQVTAFLLLRPGARAPVH